MNIVNVIINKGIYEYHNTKYQNGESTGDQAMADV